MLIGLSGASRAGKDSVAHILVKDYGFEQVALASAIRKILLDLDPMLNDEQSLVNVFQRCDGDWDRVKAEAPGSVEWMISLGQSCRDNIGEDVWLRAALNNYDPSKNMVISDCRQVNEVQWIRDHGGMLWKIFRPRLEQFRGMDNLLDDVEFDAVLINDGSLEHLESLVERQM